MQVHAVCEGAGGGQKEVVDPLELELYVVQELSKGGGRNQTLLLCKGSKYS